MSRFAGWMLLLAIVAPSPRAGGGEPPGPLSAEASLAAFDVLPGHVVELVAAEPLVLDPVAIAWDADGRLFVAEMADYPNASGGGRVVTLADTDGDGQMDVRTVFADGLPFPNGLLPWRGGMLVTAAPDILWLHDGDGDGRADERRIVLTGFAPGNQQLRVNGLTFGPDGWVYAANGRSGGSVTSPLRPDAPAVSIDRHDLRFHPDTGLAEAVAGWSQFGLAIDPFGDRFSNWNTAPVRHVVFPLDVAVRHPHATPAGDMETLADPARGDRIFPISGPPTTFNREATDAFNASCGPAIDVGGLLDPPGCLYVCEPLVNIVHRRQLVPRGATFEARRPAGEEEREFLASRDPWFRPVFTASGPDGGLWICDFYRRWVEHPDFVRGEARDTVAWDEGKDRGRIWRVRPTAVPGMPVRPLANLPPEALVGRLESGTGWERNTALRLIAELAGPDRDRARRSLGAIGRLPEPAPAAAAVAAAAALVGLDTSTWWGPDDPRLRRQRLRLARGQGAGDATTVDADAGVRFEQALAAAAEPADARAVRLLDILGTGAADRWVDAAAQAVADDAAPAMVASLVAAATADPRSYGLVRTLAGACAADDRLAARLSETVGRADPAALTTRAAVAGWAAARRSAGRPVGDGFGGRSWGDWVDDARAGLAGGPIDVDSRRDAITLLAGDDRPESIGAIVALLAEPGDAAATAEVLAGLRGRDDPRIATAIVAAWSTASPAVRTELLAALLARESRVPVLAAALEDGTIAAAEVDPESRQRLLDQASRADHRGRLEQLFGGLAASDRVAVVAAAESRLPADGDGMRGRDVFTRHCAACHRAGGIGERVGPELAGLGSKSPAQLLEDILDPNRRVSGEYAALVLVTADGESLVGLPAGETPAAVLLRRPGGGLETVSRSRIEAIRGTGRSLMPEGFEQTLGAADLADVIAFLRGRP